MAITVTSVAPVTVAFDGGYPLDLVGVFPVGERLNVHIGELGTTEDPLCLSGKVGQGSDVYAQDSSYLRVYSPLYRAGGPFSVLVVAPDIVDQGSLAAAITYVVAPYYLGVLNLRAVFPPCYRTGPRRLEQVGNLYSL